MKKLLTDSNFNGWESRDLKTNPSTFKEDKDGAIVEAILTTEKAAEVIDWEKWEMVREILLMDGAQIPETKQVPLLDSHSRFAISNIKGSVRNLRVEKGNDLELNRIVGDVHFWSGSVDEISLVKEGHLTDLSVGYRISENENDTVEIKPGKSETIITENGERTFTNDSEMRLLIRKKWWPKEGSLVAIGADDLAKFRSEQQPSLNSRIKADDPELQALIDKTVNEKINSITSTKNQKENIMDELTLEQRVENEVNRQNAIKQIAETFGKNFKPGDTKLRETVDLAIKEKWESDKFKALILDNFDSTKSVDSPLTQLDLEKSDLKDYSLLDGINAMLNGTFGKGKSGLVKSVSDEIAGRLTKLGVAQHDNSFFVPNDYWAKTMSQKAMTTATPAAAGYLVGTDFRGDMFIELLRSKLALGTAGVTMLTGLRENITIPKQLTDGTFEIVGEGSAASESGMTFDQVTGHPRIGSGYQEFTKLLLAQSNPSIENLVRESLLATAARGIDRYGLIGSGGSEPTGIINVSGTNPVVVGGDPDWTDIVSFETKIETANAAVGDISWLMPPYIKGRCKTIPKLSGSQYSGWLMETNGEMNGYQSVISTIVPNYYLMLGVWKQMILASWGATEVQVNPFIKMKEGIVQVVLFAYFDWLTRQPTAFAISEDVTES